MALNTKYILASDLMGVFRDKDTGLPLANGIITFYRDESRNTKKPVYQLSGSPPYTNSSYTVLPNPMQLGSDGTYQDALGNSIVPYWYPYDSGNNIDLYYVTVDSAGGVRQFDRIAWPNTTGTDLSELDETNFIPNGQFLAHNNHQVSATASGVTTTYIAQGGWTTEISSAGGGVYSTTFTQNIQKRSGLNDFPRYSCRFKCTSSGLESRRDLSIKWNNVNQFENGTVSVPVGTQNYSLSFAYLNHGSDINYEIVLIKYFGTGGSPSSVPEQVIGTGTFSAGYNYITPLQFPFGSNAAYTVGTDNNDFVQIAIRPAGSSTFDIEFTDFMLVIGNFDDIHTFLPMTNARMLSEGVAGWMPMPNPDGSDLYLPLVLTPQGMTFDRSQIGMIYGKTGSSSGNELYLNGTTYIYTDYSSLGIPYSRLADYLIGSTPNISIVDGGLGVTAELTAGAANGICPIWGTGDNFVTCYNKTGSVSTVFLVQINTVAAGVVADGAVPTGWTLAALSANRTYQWTPTGVPTAGQYWTFTDGSLGKVYNVWYSVDGVGTVPATPTGANINVALTSSDTVASTITKTLKAVNQYQFKLINGAGQFWRGLDTSHTLDPDALTRTISSITFGTTALTGANLGSSESASFLQHQHNDTFSAHIEYFSSNVGGGGTPTYRQDSPGGTALTIVPANATVGGGNETRPVNLAINWYVKY